MYDCVTTYHAFNVEIQNGFYFFWHSLKVYWHYKISRYIDPSISTFKMHLVLSYLIRFQSLTFGHFNRSLTPIRIQCGLENWPVPMILLHNCLITFNVQITF